MSKPQKAILAYIIFCKSNNFIWFYAKLHYFLSNTVLFDNVIHILITTAGKVNKYRTVIHGFGKFYTESNISKSTLFIIIIIFPNVCNYEYRMSKRSKSFRQTINIIIVWFLQNVVPVTYAIAIVLLKVS